MNDFIRVMKALSDPNRVKMIKMLQRKSMCVCEMQAALEIAQPTVSNHLKVLEEAGLVTYRKDGLWVNYSPTEGESSPYAATMLGALRHWLGDDPDIALLMERLPGIRREVICKKKENIVKSRVLFLCTGNTARSQMAEAFLRRYGGENFEAYSAGLKPSVINPYTVRVMGEAGIDLSGHRSKGFKEFLGKVNFTYLITVCSEAEEDCPTTFPGVSHRLEWRFEDPAAFEGPEEEKLKIFRQVRDQIEAQVKVWIEEPAAAKK